MSRLTLTGLVLIAASVALVVFVGVRAQWGPSSAAAVGATRTYICTNPACSEVFRLAAPPPGHGMDERFRCPACHQAALAFAERCTTCGALIPRPRLKDMPDAVCPRCGGAVYGKPPANGTTEK